MIQSKHWTEPRVYTHYRPVPIFDGQILHSAELDEWIEETQWFHQDLDWLLSLEHFR